LLAIKQFCHWKKKIKDGWNNVSFKALALIVFVTKTSKEKKKKKSSLYLVLMAKIPILAHHA